MRRRLKRLALGIAAMATMVVATFVAWPLPPAGLVDYGQIASVRILDRQGDLLRELRSSADGRAEPISVARMPPRLRQAIVAAEDRRFFHHLGIDPIGVAGAAWRSVRAGRIAGGGSTLTQQLSRALVPRPKTLWGKAKEALWALRLEAHLSKEEILTQYLNRAPFGNQTFGVEAAAQLYFGRSAEHLSLAQCAALAALPNAPTTYNPYRHPDRLAKAQRRVLRKMVREGFITDEAERDAVAEPLDLVAFDTAFRAPHWTTFIADAKDGWGLRGATTLRTTLDAELEADVGRIVTEELGALRQRNVSSAAVLVIDNLSGEVLAYLGSADFFDDEGLGQNDGVRMRRQPGSALKPFAYLEALSDGFTPASVLEDLPSTFAGTTGPFVPHNYDRQSHGPVRLREALANSDNVPAVRIAEALGPTRLLSALRRAGFQSLRRSEEHYGLGLVLGDGEVSLWELGRAYAGLARGGELVPLRVLSDASTAEGDPIALPALPPPRRFAQPGPVALLTDILSDNAARARAFGSDSVLRLPFAVAAKTGTSKGYGDNWTVGFTHERTVAVWAGNFDGSKMADVSGITGAGPIFRRVMERAMRGIDPAPLLDSSGLEHARICPLTGLRAGPHCPSAMEEVFLAGTAPTQGCDAHDALAPDAAPECDEVKSPTGAVTDLGADYYPWQAQNGLSKRPWLAATCRREGRAHGVRSVRIAQPSDDAVFRLFADLPRDDQAIPVRVVADAAEGTLELWLDGKALAPLPAPFTFQLPPAKGRHVLSVHRPGDAQPLAQTRFVVRADEGAY